MVISSCSHKGPPVESHVDCADPWIDRKTESVEINQRQAQVSLSRISSRQQDCALFRSSLVRVLAMIYSRMLPSAAEKTHGDPYRLCGGRP